MQTNAKDQIWFQKKLDIVEIGFTNRYLEELNQCWHILPARPLDEAIKEKSPLMSIETNDSLCSILSPVDGFIKEFNESAINFPDKLLSTDILFCIGTTKPEKARSKKPTQGPQRTALEARIASLTFLGGSRETSLTAAQFHQMDNNNPNCRWTTHVAPPFPGHVRGTEYYTAVLTRIDGRDLEGARIRATRMDNEPRVGNVPRGLAGMIGEPRVQAPLNQAIQQWANFEAGPIIANRPVRVDRAVRPAAPILIDGEEF